MRLLIVVLLLMLPASVPAASVLAQATPAWVKVAGGSNLVRPVFWEGLAEAITDDGVVSVQSQNEAMPVVDRYGPRLAVPGDFRVVASVQSATDDLAVLSLIDAVPEDQWGPAMRRIELGLDKGQVVVEVFDGTSPAPTDRQTFAAESGPGTGTRGPITLALARAGAQFIVELSGTEVTEFADTGIFSTGKLLLGARTAAGNQLTLDMLDVQASADHPTAVHVDRCAPARLLIAGADQTDVNTGLWWVWPDDNSLRQVESSQSQRSFLVAVSPDKRWVLYYQRSSKPSDRFIVDTWVMDLATDERVKLVDESAPLGWIADGSAVVLGERPYLMASVPSGELVPTVGQLAPNDALRTALSPDGKLRAAVATTPTGAGGVNIFEAGSSEPTLRIATGRGAVELAWSPDSSQLAYTSGVEGPEGLIWRLRILDLASGTISLVDTPGDLQIHSVVWAPQLAGCAA